MYGKATVGSINVLIANDLFAYLDEPVMAHDQSVASLPTALCETSAKRILRL